MRLLDTVCDTYCQEYGADFAFLSNFFGLSRIIGIHI